MPPLSEGVAALVQLFSDARRRGAPMTLTVEQVDQIAMVLMWVDRDVEALRERLRRLEIDVCGLEAVGCELRLPLQDASLFKERAAQALRAALDDGKAVLFPGVRRPAFCDGGAYVSP